MNEQLSIIEVAPESNVYGCTHGLLWHAPIHKHSLYAAYGTAASLAELADEMSRVEGVNWSDFDSIRDSKALRQLIIAHMCRQEDARAAAVEQSTNNVKVECDEDECRWTCPKCGTKGSDSVFPSLDSNDTASDTVHAKCKCGWAAEITATFTVSYELDGIEVEEE